jgi:hypothetical protein
MSVALFELAGSVEAGLQRYRLERGQGTRR